GPIVARPAATRADRLVATRPARTPRTFARPPRLVVKRRVTRKRPPETLVVGSPSDFRTAAFFAFFAFFFVGALEKVAVTDGGVVTVSVQVVFVPEQAPPQPWKPAPLAAVACSSTLRPAAKCWTQVFVF